MSRCHRLRNRSELGCCFNCIAIFISVRKLIIKLKAKHPELHIVHHSQSLVYEFQHGSVLPTILLNIVFCTFCLTGLLSFQLAYCSLWVISFNNNSFISCLVRPIVGIFECQCIKFVAVFNFEYDCSLYRISLAPARAPWRQFSRIE